MRSLKGKREAVSLIPAPVLQMVDVLIAESEWAPALWYSMMAPVPPSAVQLRERHPRMRCPVANLAGEVDTGY